MFALEPSQVAMMVNLVSGVSSAFTILFMFWTITNITRKLNRQRWSVSQTARPLPYFGSALVGSLAFTYSDSFWFNAVETEVYAMASFIMALLLWMGLKWDRQFRRPAWKQVDCTDLFRCRAYFRYPVYGLFGHTFHWATCITSKPTKRLP